MCACVYVCSHVCNHQVKFSRTYSLSSGEGDPSPVARANMTSSRANFAKSDFFSVRGLRRKSSGVSLSSPTPGSGDGEEVPLRPLRTLSHSASQDDIQQSMDHKLKKFSITKSRSFEDLGSFKGMDFERAHRANTQIGNERERERGGGRGGGERKSVCAMTYNFPRLDLTPASPECPRMENAEGQQMHELAEFGP